MISESVYERLLQGYFNVEDGMKYYFSDLKKHKCEAGAVLIYAEKPFYPYTDENSSFICSNNQFGNELMWCVALLNFLADLPDELVDKAVQVISESDRKKNGNAYSFYKKKPSK